MYFPLSPKKREEPKEFYSLACVCCGCVLYTGAFVGVIYFAYYIYIVPNLACLLSKNL